MKFFKLASKVFDGLIEVCTWFVGIYLLFAMLSVSAGVLLRYFFDKPLGWTTEISYYSLIPLALLAAPRLLRDGGHIIVDLIMQFISADAKRIVSIITCFFSAALLLVISVYGFIITREMYVTNYLTDTFLMMPKWPLVGISTLGIFMTAIQFVRNAIKWIKDEEVAQGSTEE